MYLINLLFFTLPLIGFSLILIITGLFEWKKYYNETLYLAIVAVILVGTLVINYIRSYPPVDQLNKIIYFMGIGLVVLGILGFVYDFNRYVGGLNKSK